MYGFCLVGEHIFVLAKDHKRDFILGRSLTEH